jgi:hypothetical protein
MVQGKKRTKSEPTKGDLLAQSYRNRAAMFRVYEAARAKHYGTVYTGYWTPFDIRTLGM